MAQQEIDALEKEAENVVKDDEESVGELVATEDQPWLNQGAVENREVVFSDISIANMEERKRELLELRQRKDISKKARSFYNKQDALVSSFLDPEGGQTMQTLLQDSKSVAMAAKASLFVNLILLIAKAVAAGLSDSLAIVSSVVDSAVDLVSGLVLWYAGRSMKRMDVYHYPQGRSRLEPVAIVILSCIMAMASVILIRESIEKVIGKKISPDLSVPTLAIIGGTVIAKIALFLYCRRFKQSPTAKALAEDHRNDILSNLFAVVFGALGAYVWIYADPIGAIVISIYIFFNWWRTGSEQIKALTGHSAPPHLLQKITWVCLQHSKQINKIETVRAYTFGPKYLAEVDIVLLENMTLKEAHDIGEPLQRKLENMPEIERAFVHLDYEVNHRASDEHKMAWSTVPSIS